MKPDGFTSTLIKRTDDYVYFEFQSPTFGFIDDVRTSPLIHSHLYGLRGQSALNASLQRTCKSILAY